MKVVNLFGLYMTGKSALYDLLTERKNVFSISPHFDLDIVRIPNGINDLILSIQNCSVHHQSLAIDRFLKVLYQFDSSSFGGLEKFFCQRSNYPKFFLAYKSLKMKLISELTKDQWRCHHFHSYYSDGPLETFTRKILLRLGRVTNNCTLYSVEKQYVINALQEFVKNLLLSANGYRSEELFILNNMNFVESSHLSEHVIPNVIQYAVIRNPLDVYSSIINSDAIHNKVPDIAIRLNRASNFDEFISGYDRQLGYLDSARIDNLTIIKFEDIVADPNAILSLIEKKVQVGLRDVTQQLFYADVSKKGVGLWKRQKDVAANSHIENKLKGYEYISKYYGNCTSDCM
ncbi:MAG: hypothetical protein Q8M05_19290 [Rhodoferax sp.]|uniref:hypothetical protein n=1 Tax=Rhodoferax sp. TaxID=50421 RepID=UPI00272F46A2|nr:hypothetical protein [Rhodoferax sp.]MDP1531515.1 hypothetical protein [Rhodoferax sp.]MDP1942947.1 hypothetical protein [Rhodoferax sp.]